MGLKNILKEEMIGSSIEIVESNNQTLIGIKGKIIDETKETFTIKTKEKNKKVMKKKITFIIEKKGKKIKINGDKICFRPEDRIKKIR